MRTIEINTAGNHMQESQYPNARYGRATVRVGLFSTLITREKLVNYNPKANPDEAKTSVVIEERVCHWPAIAALALVGIAILAYGLGGFPGAHV